jgi:hypothetical protein
MTGFSMTGFRFALAFMLLAWVVPAGAADVVYPVGSRLGLVPPPGMTAPLGAQGFEDRGTNSAILMIALPQKLYAEVEQIFAENLTREGIMVEKRESLETELGTGMLAVGRQAQFGTRKWVLAVRNKDVAALVTVQIPDGAALTYPDDVIRTTLATLTARASVPDEEQMSLLPFDLRDRAGFHIGAVLPGRGLMLSDADRDADDFATAPHMFVGAAPGAPSIGEDRGVYAQRLFSGIANLKEVRILSAEPLRLSGTVGYQIMANAKDAQTGVDLTLVQWLRFGNSTHVEMIGTAKTDDWSSAYPRFRAVRDSFGPH